jgi:hypothetical protein
MSLFQVEIREVEKTKRGEFGDEYKIVKTPFEAFLSCEDVTLWQALAQLLNHISSKEEIRETQERMFVSDPDLERDMYHAQLRNQYGADFARHHDGPSTPISDELRNRDVYPDPREPEAQKSMRVHRTEEVDDK